MRHGTRRLCQFRMGLNDVNERQTGSEVIFRKSCRYRWESEGVLSVYVQEKPQKPGAPSPLRVISFRAGPSAGDESQ